MEYTIEGTIKSVSPSKTGEKNGKQWGMQDILLTTNDDKYPQTVSMQLSGEKLIDKLKKGQEVKLTFSIRGREYKEKWYNSLSVFKFEVLKEASQQQSSPQSSNDAMPVDDQNLPF